MRAVTCRDCDRGPYHKTCLEKHICGGGGVDASFGNRDYRDHATSLAEFAVLALVVGLIVGELVALADGMWNALSTPAHPVEAHERSV